GPNNMQRNIMDTGIFSVLPALGGVLPVRRCPFVRRGAVFFLMLRRPPGPTLFPYTTRFRSGTAHCGGVYRGERSGAGGAKGGDQGECGPGKHVPGAEPDKRVTGAGTHTAICRHTPEVGAVCGKAARTVLCGGRALKRTSLPLRAPGKAGAIQPVKVRPKLKGSVLLGSECCVATGDGGCEAYTAIAWGVGLSHERS